MGSVMQKTRVILWKSYVLRKRHWLLTLFEVAAPLLLFFFFAKYLPSSQDSGQVVVVPAANITDVGHMISVHSSYFSSESSPTIRQIAYAPKTLATKNIMAKLEEKLKKTQVNRNYNLTSFRDGTELNNWLQSKSDWSELLYTVGILFDSDATKTDLRYTIRVFQEVTPPVDEYFGRDPNIGNYFSNMFLYIQMVFDSIFLKRMTGKDFNINVQPFPQEDLKSIANYIFPLVTTFSFVFVVPAVLKKVVEEKMTGIKELQRMMGLNTWMLWSGWMIHSLIIYATSAVIITVMLRILPWGEGQVPVYEVENPLIFLYLLFLFIVTMILFCFAVSTFFTSPNIAMISGILLWVVPPFVYFDRLTSGEPAPHLRQMASCISPPICLSWSFTIFSNFQQKGKVWSWSDFLEQGTTGGLSMGHIVLMFYFDWLLFAFITWYVDAVKPGPYGRAKKFYFIFQLCMGEKDIVGSIEDVDQRTFEPPPRDSKIGISIQNLRKVFGSKVAVDKVNLDMYEGEITALLGHNGAGKTTTMSMLTGLFSPTKGVVLVDGCNIFDKMDRFRQNLGLCPQHNLLFSYLTVIEHLIFFGMLKGFPKELAEVSGLNLLASLNMVSKSGQFPAKLSGGMKRKLCLAIALMGDPKVLMLDEPTAGMDPESRREVWDILLSYRGERSILITTHFMEEADVLGDRIAIMDHGRVSCYGTSIFLKKLYGTGYSIVITKRQSVAESTITTVVSKHLADARLKSELPTQLTFNASSSDSTHFPDLFSDIESRKEELGIIGIGIACTTMEDVFLKVAEGDLPLEAKAIPAEVLLDIAPSAITKVKHDGWKLCLHQLRALSIKKLLVIRRTWLGTLTYGITPLLAVLLLYRGYGGSEKTDKSAQLDLALYPSSEVPFTAQDLSSLTEVSRAYQALVAKQGSTAQRYSGNIVQGLIKKMGEDRSFYSRAVVAAELNSSSLTALFNHWALHAAPVALNLLSNAIIKAVNPACNIAVTNHPFTGQVTEEKQCDAEQRPMMPLMALVMAVPWILLAITLMIVVSRVISHPLSERATNAKQVQLMTGLSPVVYWVSHFIWDFLFYLVAMSLAFIAFWILDTGRFYTASGKMSLLFFLLLFYGISGIPFAYLVSFMARSSAKAAALFLMFNLITGIVLPLVLLSIGVNFQPGWKVLVAEAVLNLNPLYAETAALVRLLVMMAVDSSCGRCNNFCVYMNPFEPQSKNKWSILQYVLFLLFEWAGYWLVIFLIEFGLVRRTWARLAALWIGTLATNTVADDDDVIQEKEKVKRLLTNKGDPSDSGSVLRVCGLGKKYSRHSVAVHEVSFLVQRGECFGLLGVNGAGKTTTFKMLTGEETPTIGTAAILARDLVHNKSEYLRQVGYCPQFDAIVGYLTGEEMLLLFGALRGIPLCDLNSEVNKWVRYMGLEEFAGARCGRYSGGNKRKLSTAMALIAEPPVVLLDEPTAGVDPVSRRKLWDVLAQCQRAGQAVVLTSHSMEECEALCSRLTILVGGQMKCLGTTQHLKQKFGRGFTIMLKLSSAVPSGDKAVTALKDKMNRTFANCFIKDEHKGLLHYHLADSGVALSQVFGALEELRRSQPLVEDYTVGDTTLEQVFMSFAQQVPPAITVEPVEV